MPTPPDPPSESDLPPELPRGPPPGTPADTPGLPSLPAGPAPWPEDVPGQCDPAAPPPEEGPAGIEELPPAVPEAALRAAEALLFASAEPVRADRLAALLPELDPGAVLEALARRYAGRGVEVVSVAGGHAFRTAADLAPLLTRVIERPRRLPRAALEILAVVAWHQPVTRAEIEEVRGVALSQPSLDALLEAGLVSPLGRRDTPGRPSLWGTTPRFLEVFGLASLRELPRPEELMPEGPSLLAEPEAAR